MPAPPKPRSNVHRILGDMLTFEYIPPSERAARARANLLAAGKGTGKAMLGAIGAPADLIQLGSDAGSWLTGSTPQALPGADYMPTTEHLTSWADQALGGNSFLTREAQNPGEAQAAANTEALGMFNPLSDFKMAAMAGSLIPAAKKTAKEIAEEAKAGLGKIGRGEKAPEVVRTTVETPGPWRDQPLANAPYPQYAEAYPPVGPPTMKPKTDPKTGEVLTGEKAGLYPEKTLTPEGAAFMKQRDKIRADMNKKGYEPYFPPEQRFPVDPKNYPPPNIDTLTVIPKKPDTLKDYRKIAEDPRVRENLRAMYERGKELGGGENWYAMGQVEKEYIKHLGPDKGRQAFLDEWVAPFASTTSGQDPGGNLLMGHYLEYMRKHGLQAPEGHQIPAPVGGRRVAMNVRDYNKMRAGGGYPAFGETTPKMHDFTRSLIGDLSHGTFDEQMAAGAYKGHPADMRDKMRTSSYGLSQEQLQKEAAAVGVEPGSFQDVAWLGGKGGKGKPMIEWINEAIERTHRLTGMPRSEIVRRAIINKEIPLYGIGGLGAAGLAATQAAPPGAREDAT